MPRFHAHVYFSPAHQTQAQTLWTKASADLANGAIKVGPLEPGLRGPHLMFQFEIDFGEADLVQMLAWLMKNRDGLSVLVHPELEDEMKSHLNEALWFGIPLPLDFTKLDLRSRGREFKAFGVKPSELDL